MSRIDAFLKLMREQKASYLHLASGRTPSLRIMGNIVRVKYHEMHDDELKELLYEILPNQKAKIYEETGQTHFAYEIPRHGRYRVCVYMQNHGVAAVFKAIPKTIRTVQELNLPPVISRLASLSEGLVIVTGPAGSGKSTTLAAIIDEANRTRKDHIVTIEDPIEYVHENKECIVEHQEVGSYADGLRNVLRTDPKIILVDEMRDQEAISLAIEAASNGHLVLGTIIHTSSAPRVVDYIIEVFPKSQQSQVRSTLSESLRAIIAQVLFNRIDKMGRVPSLEIMIANSSVRNLVREGKTFQIPYTIMEGKKYGIQHMDGAIFDLLEKGWISGEEAYLNAFDKAKFRSFLKNPPLDFTEA